MSRALDQKPPTRHDRTSPLSMRVAVLVTHAGVPGTLGTTAFVSALSEGLEANGITSCVVGLTHNAAAWRSDALPNARAITPWLDRSAATDEDLMAAVAYGIAAPGGAHAPDGSRVTGWHEEYLLERALGTFADRMQLHLIVHPRSYQLLDLATRIARRRGWGVVVLSNEALTEKQIDPATRDAYIEVASSATGVWAVSEYLREFWLDHGMQADRILVEPGMVSPTRFLSERRSPSFGAVYMGNLMHREVETLLDVSAQVVESEPSYRLTIFGDATHDARLQLRETVRLRGLADVVSVEDAIAPDEIPATLSSATLLLLPRSSGAFSTAGFPQKLGEYLASGTPVVVTDVGDIPKYLEDGINAYLVRADDTDAFAVAVGRALRDPNAARIGVAGRDLAGRLLNSHAASYRLAAFLHGLPKPRQEWGPLQARAARGARALAQRIEAMRWAFRRLRDSLAKALGRLQGSIVYARSGHTRVMAAKIAIVRLLRFMRLKPPPPRE